MRLDRRKVVRVLAGILFALATIKIHYVVKVEMERSGSGDTGQLENVQVGSESPDFSATDLQGRKVTLSEFRDHKMVVMDFWATWCAPLRDGDAEAAGSTRRIQGSGGGGSGREPGRRPDLVRRFVEQKKYTFRVVADQNRAIGNRFGVRGIPALVVINPDGRIGWTRVGYTRTGRMSCGRFWSV